MFDTTHDESMKDNRLPDTQDPALHPPLVGAPMKAEGQPSFDSKQAARSPAPAPARTGKNTDGLPSRPPSRRRNRRRELLLGAGILLLSVACWLGWRYGSIHTMALTQAEATSFQPEITGPGTLDATRKASISSTVQARLLHLAVEENDSVREGELLAELDDAEAKAQLASLEASVEASRQAVVMVKAELQQAQVGLANARAEFGRQTRLLETNTTSRSSYETAETALARAEADKAKAEANIQQSQSQMIASAKSAEAQRALLGKYRIHAPLAGIIIDRTKDIGDTLTVGSSFIEIVDPDSIVVTTRFDESLITRVGQGLTAYVTFSASPDDPVFAEVTRVGRQVDEETREFEVDVKPDRLPAHWAIGQRANVVVKLTAKTATITIPTTALNRVDGQPGVWLSDDGRARWQPVTVGAVAGGRIEVRSGLAAGDIYVTAPTRLYHGMRIKAQADLSGGKERS
ncbi:efflux RND transporter periplasmic adaptor subunit [Cohaesibacter haloalkalitolerans]|uniref:efflux RND transporter periplasmic adaptor subunit n=1 Tax=Cohaesibacter haloalkalitolerans TaxID=1162980 RepID=UPI000E64E0CC|nr:efflux RND transporter periplasmic adaptor subunit [Cohaesibacter haloalkalitolerans]